jgi:ACS family hexuronate transporter-like MFS transporter
MIALQLALAIGLLGSGWFFDRVGVRLGMAISVTGWSLAACLHAVARTATQFVSARAVLGLMESAITPGGLRLITAAFPARLRTPALGLLNSASNVSAVLTPFAVALLFGSLGWKWTVVIIGGAGLICAGLWLFLPERFGNASVINESEAEPQRISWRLLLADRHCWVIILGKVLADQVWWFMLFWMPDYFHRSYGVYTSEMGLPVASVYLMAAVGAIGGGLLPRFVAKYLDDGSRIRFIVLGVFALMALPLAFLPLIQNLGWAICIMGVALAGHQGFSTNIYGVAASAYGSREVAHVIGIAAFCGNVAGALIGQAAVWQLSTHGNLHAIFIECGLAYLVCWLLIRLIAPRLRG